MTAVKPASGGKLGRLVKIGASIIAGIAVVAALITNLTTITQFAELIVGVHSAPKARKVVKVCMGNGGGDNCLGGADAHFDCNAYKAMGGGSKQTYDSLADRFCGFTANGVRKVDPNSIIVYQNNGGGECGWTGFQVTCN